MCNPGGEEAELGHPVGEDELLAERVALSDVARNDHSRRDLVEADALWLTELETA